MYLASLRLLGEARAEAAQQAPATAKPTGYTIFLRGTPVGREEVTVREDATGTTIIAQGRLGAPLNVVTRRAEMKYAADWTPERFTLDASANGGDVSVRTSFVNGTAQTEGNQGTAKIATSHPFSPQTVVLPNGVFRFYAALADRLSSGDCRRRAESLHPAARRDRRARRQRSAGADPGRHSRFSTCSATTCSSAIRAAISR